MMDSLFNICAVPYGFVSVAMDSDVTDVLEDVCSPADVTTMLIDERFTRGVPPLPDLVMSTALPPHLPQEVPDALRLNTPSSAVPREGKGGQVTTQKVDARSGNPTSGSGDGVDDEVADESLRRNVNRIREIRTRYDLARGRLGAHQTVPSVEECPRHPRQEVCLPSHPSPPPPPPPRTDEYLSCSSTTSPPRDECKGCRGLMALEDDLSDEERVRSQCGVALRRVADQFQLEHAKVRRKNCSGVPSNNNNNNNNNNNGAALSSSVIGCLSVSFLFLVWWRIFNKLR